MEEGRPSRTALRVALRRAAHQVVDARPLVLEDPFAVPILGPEYGAELMRTPQRGDRPHSRALRAFMVARSRFAEDTLAAAASAGVTQYVLLGAGLDTIALRNPFAGQVRVFEVDHPATQAWKRSLLERGDFRPRGERRYVPVDFERQVFGEELARAGFDAGARTVVAWLGVAPYLTTEAFRATVRWVRALPAGSEVVLDYGQPREVLPALEQLAHDSLAARVAQAGEPFRSFWTSEAMRAELAGFAEVEDLGRDEVNARYFAGRTDGLRLLGSAGRMVRARV